MYEHNFEYDEAVTKFANGRYQLFIYGELFTNCANKNECIFDQSNTKSRLDKMTNQKQWENVE